MTDQPERPPQQIEALTGLEAVRRRPHMYFSPEGRLADGVLAETLRDHLYAGHEGRHLVIKAVIHSEWSFTTTDDGDGFPALHGPLGGDFATELACGGYLQGMLAAVNAMARTLVVSSTDDGSGWRKTYEHGVRTSLKPASPSRGTTVVVELDPTTLPVGLSPEVSSRDLPSLILGDGAWVNEETRQRLSQASITITDER